MYFRQVARQRHGLAYTPLHLDIHTVIFTETNNVETPRKNLCIEVIGWQHKMAAGTFTSRRGTLAGSLHVQLLPVFKRPSFLAGRARTEHKTTTIALKLPNIHFFFFIKYEGIFVFLCKFIWPFKAHISPIFGF